MGYTSAAATILHCYNTGNIKACNADGTYLGSSNYVGGIVGFAQADVSYCANIRGIIEGNDYPGYDLAQIPDDGDPHPRYGLIPRFEQYGIEI